MVNYDPKQPTLWRESVEKCVRVLNVKHMLEDPYVSLLKQAQHTEGEQNRDLEPRGSQESTVSESGRGPRVGSPSVVKREE